MIDWVRGKKALVWASAIDEKRVVGMYAGANTEVLRTWVDIDLDSIVNNLREIRALLPRDTKIIGVVKSDAYGHGVIPVGKILTEHGVNALAVSCIREAAQLREAEIRLPILYLNPLLPDEIPKALDLDLTPSVGDSSTAVTISEEAVRRRCKIQVHVKIDTGLGRYGIPHLNAIDQLEHIFKLSGIEIEGVYTHLARAHLMDDQYTRLQLSRFAELQEKLRLKGISIPQFHIAASSAVLHYPESVTDTVRVGTLFYGYFPSPRTRTELAIRPALSWKTRVSGIRKLPPGFSIGYSGRFTTARDTAMAIIPVGSADGIPVSLAGKAYALVHGKRVPYIGDVYSNSITLDITDVSGINVGDEVVLLGKQGENQITYDEMAEAAGIGVTQLLTGISKTLPVFYRGGEATLPGQRCCAQQPE